MSWFREINAIADFMEETARELQFSANAFSTVGQGGFACKLYGKSKALREKAEELRQIVSGKIDGDWKQARQSSANMLNACLAGVKLGQEEKK